MKKLLTLMMMLSFNLSSAPYETAQRFSQGDTISADVLNDVLDRLELSLKEIEVPELVGEWAATQYVCNDGGQRSDLDATLNQTGACNNQVNLQSGTNVENLLIRRSDIVTVTRVSGSDTAVNMAFEANQMFCPDGAGDCWPSNNIAATHECIFTAYGALLACKLDEATPRQNGGRITAFFNVTRLSPTRLKLFWGPYRGASIFNFIILDKGKLPPKTPKNLSVSLSSGEATLTYVPGDATQTGYDVQRKEGINGSYVSIETPSFETYVDSTITKGKRYWYRVFAKNANGTSSGSNVIQINYGNTPPSINVSSTVSVIENTISVISVGATDANGDGLTYSISNVGSGTDAEDLSITSEGTIQFNAAPDYEAPADSDTNNIYNIRVVVSDGTDETTQDVSVVVLDDDGD